MSACGVRCFALFDFCQKALTLIALAHIFYSSLGHNSNYSSFKAYMCVTLAVSFVTPTFLSFTLSDLTDI